MPGSSKIIIAYTLLISAVLHGFLLFYESDEANFGLPFAESTYLSVSLEYVKALQDRPVSNLVKLENTSEVKTEELLSKEIDQKKILAVSPVVENTQDKIKYSDKKILLKSQADAAEPETRMLSGERRVLLLSLLHNEINAHKKYPYMALRQRHEGLVKINFMLHPDGNISDISIVESSDYNLLDAAARLAVQNISPLHVAGNYLQQTELFNVDIEFRLN